MDAATVAAIAQALRALGPWGVFVLALALNLFPALLVLGFWWLVEWRRERLAKVDLAERSSREQQRLAGERQQVEALERLLRDGKTEVDRALKKVDEIQESQRREVSRILEKHGDGLRRVTDFYNNNVELVRAFHRLSEDFHTTITLNTQIMQKVCDKIDANWFCPVLKDRGGKS